MPHLNIEYSANLSEGIDIQELIATLHRAALSTGIFPVGGIRTRAERRDDYLIADGRADAGYIHLMVRIGHGRDAATRRAAGDAIFGALCRQTESLFESRPLAISFELHEIPPDMSWRKNNLHELVGETRG